MSTLREHCDQISADLMTWHRVEVWDEDLHKVIIYRARRIDPEDAKVGHMVSIRNSLGVMIGRLLPIDQ